MAVNVSVLNRRPSDRSLYLTAAVLFPLLVLVGYARTYYFSSFFDAAPLATRLVHVHGFVMSTWVVYFVAQVALVRSKNLKLHMSMGFAGIGLAAVVVIVGMMTAWDAHMVREVAPAGIPGHSFFLVPAFDMLLFVIFFGGAIYYRKRPAEHKALMLMTAINFVPAAIARIPLGIPPQFMIVQAFAIPFVLGLIALGYLWWKHGKLNKIFAAALALYAVSLVRVPIAGSELWLNFANWLTS
jgi:hypothetical protein